MTQGTRPSPRRRFVHNPAWTTKAIAQAWDLMRESVQPAWLPVLDSVKSLDEREIAGEVNEYGCGTYGCAFPTADPDVVLKVTTDVSEADFAADLADKIDPSVCVRYYAVIKLDMKHRGEPVQLLWRESANHVGKIAEVLGNRAAGYVHKQWEQSQVIVKLVIDREKYDERAWRTAMRSAIDGWLTACDRMLLQRDVPEIHGLAAGMIDTYVDHKIIFGDVHTGNVGLVRRDDGGHWVITDPGNIVIFNEED